MLKVLLVIVYIYIYIYMSLIVLGYFAICVHILSPGDGIHVGIAVCLTVHVLVVHAVIPTTNSFSFALHINSVLAALVNIFTRLHVKSSKILPSEANCQVVTALIEG